MSLWISPSEKWDSRNCGLSSGMDDTTQPDRGPGPAASGRIAGRNGCETARIFKIFSGNLKGTPGPLDVDFSMSCD